MQCAGNANSNVSFQVNANFISVTHLSKIKGLENNRVKTGIAVWPGVGKIFSRGQPPQDDSVGFGVVWVTGLFSLSQ